MTILMIVVPVLAGLAILLIFAGIAAPRPADQVQERLLEYGGRPLTLEEIELSRPFSERVIDPMLHGIANLLTRLAPQRNLEKTRRTLEMAGNPNNWGPTEFLGIRGLAGILLAGMLFGLFTLTNSPIAMRFLMTGVAGMLGFYLPTMWVGGRIKARQKEIVRSLPDVLDLLTIGIEAGLGFDAAMAKVVEKWDNELSRAFSRTLSEMRMGKSRREALRDMAERADVPDLTSFVAAIIQADQLGVSISRVMRIQSEQMRIKRRQRAEETAQKAPVKMLIPLAFLIFPAIFIILFGPALLTV
ncbi:MAG: type II secretion system F family protein, partial [Chloroflexi bacterium]|nr:type II secretion system F family protein [Chloroflexota bacterium]